jgi:hypothetical protein
MSEKSLNCDISKLLSNSVGRASLREGKLESLPMGFPHDGRVSGHLGAGHPLFLFLILGSNRSGDLTTLTGDVVVGAQCGECERPVPGNLQRGSPY